MVHRYFGDREGLCAAVAQGLSERAVGKTAACLSNADLGDINARLAYAVRGGMDVVRRNPNSSLFVREYRNGKQLQTIYRLATPGACHPRPRSTALTRV